MATVAEQPTTKTPRKARKETAHEKAARLLESYASIAAKIAKIKESAQSKIQPYADALADVFQELKEVAEQNTTALFGTAKTLGLEFGTIGFKLGDKKLILPEELNQKWYMQTVKDLVPGAVEEKVNDKKLIAALAVLPDLQAALAKRSIEVVQPNNFFITPKKQIKKSA
ncbi:hypothetical protein GCM10023185_14680 [Hymenobacter saemangeumensis]|uniref:Uncharacterized protein n=1 Tax=Hymenobacter saemangeumensis TaxID=1084522 RepID=A0ABP8I8T9_9BACT